MDQIDYADFSPTALKEIVRLAGSDWGDFKAIRAWYNNLDKSLKIPEIEPPIREMETWFQDA